MDNDDEKTYFGFEQIKKSHKKHRVGEVFRQVSEQYDMFNDVASLGVHRMWKAYTIWLMNLKEGHRVLDVACGSGDLAYAEKQKVGLSGEVIMCDISDKMLEKGRDRCLDKGCVIPAIKADAEKLPFKSEQFDRVSIAFGLRNVTDRLKALQEFYRVTRKGGKLVILEFTDIDNRNLTGKLYDWYSFRVLPRIGELTVGNKYPYKYLVESIKKYPRPQSISELILEAGFSAARFQKILPGVVTVHTASR